VGLLDRLFGAPPSITPAAAAAGVADGALVLVDVREAHEWAGGSAAGAERIPLGDVPQRLEHLRRSGRPVAFLCRSGMRSARATRLARDAGIDARNVSGGMIAYTRAGLPMA
jgi:rhodanese-related sulfurtransferase